MARYFIRKILDRDIDTLIRYEQREARGTDITLSAKNREQWQHCIDTYEYPIAMVDSETDLLWGWLLACQVENNIWIRQIFVLKEYRASLVADNPERSTFAEGFGAELDTDESKIKRPFPYIMAEAERLGGYAISPIAADNHVAIQHLTFRKWSTEGKQWLYPEWYNGETMRIILWNDV